MRVFSFEYCTNMYLKFTGVRPENRVRLSRTALSRLVRYSEIFFRKVPQEARLVAGLSGPKRLAYNGFEMVLAGILDKNSMSIPFTIGSVRKDHLAMDILLPVLSELADWSRRYINQMPKGLKMDIFSQKLLAQSGYKKFMAAHPNYELIGLHDLSSGRFLSQRTVYKLNFADKSTGEEVAYILKPPLEVDLVSNKPVNEEFYSRYLDLFDREPAQIRMYDGLSFIEFVDGIPSRELLKKFRLNPKYAHLKNRLIAWFAQEAALADAVTKGDRDIGFEGEIWGNYILGLDESGEYISRMVSIDHEYVFNRTDRFTIESAETGLLEMNFLTAFPEFRDLQQRQRLFEIFRNHYQKMHERIKKKQTDVKELIRKYYGDGEEVKIFESNLVKDLDGWLNMLFKKVEIFWKRHHGS